MAVSFTKLTSGSDTNAGSATTFDTASVTIPGAQLCLVVVSSSGAATPAPTIADANTRNWVQQATKASGDAAQRITMFSSLQSTQTVGTITPTWSTAPTSYQWAVHRVSGVDTDGESGADALGDVQSATGTSATSSSVTLTFEDGTNSGTFIATQYSANEAGAPEASWTELSEDGNATPNMTLTTDWIATPDTSATSTWSTGSTYVAIACEVKIPDTVASAYLTDVIEPTPVDTVI